MVFFKQTDDAFAAVGAHSSRERLVKDLPVLGEAVSRGIDGSPYGKSPPQKTAKLGCLSLHLSTHMA